MTGTRYEYYVAPDDPAALSHPGTGGEHPSSRIPPARVLAHLERLLASVPFDAVTSDPDWYRHAGTTAAGEVMTVTKGLQETLARSTILRLAQAVRPLQASEEELEEASEETLEAALVELAALAWEAESSSGRMYCLIRKE